MKLNGQEQEIIVRLSSMLIGKAYRLGAEVISDNLRMNMRIEDIVDIDCSELVEWVFWNALRVKLPDGSFNQFDVVDILSLEPDAQACAAVGEAGDLVFRRRNDDPKRICHVGIYVGEGKVVEAFSTDKGVITRSLDSFVKQTLRTTFAGIGRVNLSKIVGG